MAFKLSRVVLACGVQCMFPIDAVLLQMQEPGADLKAVQWARICFTLAAWLAELWLQYRQLATWRGTGSLK